MASLPGKSIPTFRSVGIRREGCSVLPGYNRSKIRVHRCPSVVGFRAFRSRIFPLAKIAKGAKRLAALLKLLRVLGVLGERRFSDPKSVVFRSQSAIYPRNSHAKAQSRQAACGTSKASSRSWRAWRETAVRSVSIGYPGNPSRPLGGSGSVFLGGNRLWIATMAAAANAGTIGIRSMRIL